jgi:hypothetical protein
MQHMDIWATNVMITAHQENVARALRDSQRRSVVRIGAGTLLIRLGEWLRRDVEMPRPVEGGLRPRRRPQAA